MTDRRLIPANERVALEGADVELGERKVARGIEMFVAAEVVDLLDAPSGRRERQVLQGERVTLIEDHDGFSFVQCENGYVGYLASDFLQNQVPPDHFVSTLATHGYLQPDFKSEDVHSLPFGARLRFLSEEKKFIETDCGYVPKAHLRPIEQPLKDPVTAAQMFFNAPYLWGGNSSRGIDCSGLVSAAFSACGYVVPGDSDLQEQFFGDRVDDLEQRKRGDLIFWDGHVGILVDEHTLLHANAHHMACRYEPFDQAVARISAQGDGPVTAHKRVAG